MRQTLIYRPGHPRANENGMVPRHLAGPIESKPALYVISDTMDHLKHPGTGMMIDSKAEFRRHTRASGCLEVGTDPAASRERTRVTVTEAEIVQDVRRAIAELNR